MTAIHAMAGVGRVLPGWAVTVFDRRVRRRTPLRTAWADINVADAGRQYARRLHTGAVGGLDDAVQRVPDAIATHPASAAELSR